MSRYVLAAVSPEARIPVAECSVLATDGHRLIQNTVEAALSVYDVEPYITVAGLPEAYPQHGVSLEAVFGLDWWGYDLATPLARPSEVDMGATCRWLPFADTYADGSTWVPFTGTGSVRFAADTAPPVLDEGFTYYRGPIPTAGQAMRFFGGDSLHTDGMAWASEQVTVVLVAVLHGSGVLFESGDVWESYSAGDPFFSVRYDAAGGVQFLWGGYTGMPLDVASMPAQAMAPVIVGFSIDTVRKELATAVLSPGSRFQSSVERVSDAGPVDGRFTLGSPPQWGAGAVMDVLEVDYWDTPVDLKTAMATLNRAYQVF